MNQTKGWKKYYLDYDKKAWIVLGLVLLMATVTLVFNDFMDTVRHGITVWTALFDGRLLDFYSYCDSNMPGGVWTSGIRRAGDFAHYQFLIYVIFAIWNFPLWLFERLSGLNAQDYFVCIFYAKLLVVLFLSLSAYYVVQIGKMLYGEEQARDNLILLTYLSSALLICNSVLSGCYDLLGITFMLGGVYHYLKKDYGKFLLFFAVAINFKYLPVLVFIPMVLYHQKNILLILRDLLAGASVTLVLKVLFSFGDQGGVGQEGDLAGTLSGKIFTKGFMAGGYLIPIFVILYAVFCLFVWLCLKEKEENRGDIVLYFGALPFGALFLLENPHPQWITYAIPFAVLLLIGHREKLKINLIISGIYVTVQMIAHMLFYHWVYAIDSYVSMLWYLLLGKRASEARGVDLLGLSVPDLLKMVQSRVNYEPVIEVTRIVALLLLLYINLPVRDGKKLPLHGGETTPVTAEDGKSLRIYRIWMYVLILIPCITYIGEMVLYNIR